MCCLFAHFRPAFEKVLTDAQLEACELDVCPQLPGHWDGGGDPDPVPSPASWRLPILGWLWCCRGDPGGPTWTCRKPTWIYRKLRWSRPLQSSKKKRPSSRKYQLGVENFQKVGLGLRAEMLEKQREAQRAAINAMQECNFPVRNLSECGHGTTFYEASIHRFAAEKGLAENKFLKIYWLNFSTLGYDGWKNTVTAVKEYAGLIAASPANTCLVLACPTVGGYGNTCDEDEIANTAAKMMELLKMPEHPTRAAWSHCDVWPFKLSTTVIPTWCTQVFHVQSLVTCRKKVIMSVCLPSLQLGNDRWLHPPRTSRCRWIQWGMTSDPRRDFKTSAGVMDLSRASRRKQWLSGFSLPSAWLQGLLLGLGLDGSVGCCIIDTFAYDHSMAEAIMRLSSNTSCHQCFVSALLGPRPILVIQMVPTGRSMRRKLRIGFVSPWRGGFRLATEGITVVPNWEPLSTYAGKSYHAQFEFCWFHMHISKCIEWTSSQSRLPGCDGGEAHHSRSAGWMDGRWFSSTMLLSTRRAMHTELRVNHRGSSSSGYKHQQAQAKHYQTVSCKKFQDLESQVLNSAVICQDLGTLSCKHVTFQNLACQVLKELCKISDLWLPSLDNHFHLCSCLGRPVMKDINLGYTAESLYSKSFTTWKAKSWIVQSLSRLEDMELQNCSKEICKISDLWLPSLDNHVHLRSRLGRPSHERHNSWQGSNGWNSLPQKVSRLGQPSLEYLVQSLSRLGAWSCQKM